MPSLRRTLSSPSVRSSPYHYPTSLSHSNTRTAARGPRRSSGSDVNHRRVLADIDWWRVQDGQRDEPDHLLHEREQEDDAPGVAERDADVGTGVDDAPMTASVPEGVLGVIPPPWQPGVGAGAGAFESNVAPAPFFLDMAMSSVHPRSSPESLSPLPQFADLTISPRTPLRRCLVHSPESSESSLESTPESTFGSLFPMPIIDATIMDMLLPSAYPTSPVPSSSSLTGRRPAPPGVMRAASYSFVESELSTVRSSDTAQRFADIIPVPPPFFSRTITDVDDLFY
ncbi:hypothetical protein AcW1_006180 [Taiwanofungus camphoratus]|nr:hypothetical protein AcV7_008566 [Antrodia cinnamomea]KAI0957956.1 hypothetical protein AcW1_006180 [Antrodia cinnamomea]